MGKWLARVNQNFPQTYEVHTDNTDSRQNLHPLSVLSVQKSENQPEKINKNLGKIPYVNTDNTDSGSEHLVGDLRLSVLSVCDLPTLGKNHLIKKRLLNPHRLHILRVLLKNIFIDWNEGDAASHEALEKYLDSALREYDYDVEKIITDYRAIIKPTSSFAIVCELCGYRPLFCQCKSCQEPRGEEL